ncbi:hypothetical protein [Pseudosulfitobacter koreensis]|uniref:Uncharacterized protein n=1 Tax=Pseudosulfitobacter koreensis TaxID=2968472 RepID=A0ABT1YXS2_9RHOB|nr:hypothetical protein [Pseudosulfitobacter koreense]MCR8825690.1 hypothetical protein [Pseudosulfitobacter koreense]
MVETLPLHADVPACAHALSARGLRPDLAELCTRVNAAIRDTGMTLTKTGNQRRGHILFSHPQLHLSITSQRRRLPRGIIAGAMASPITKARTPDYDRLYDDHRYTTTLTVGHGATPDTPPTAPLPLVLRLRVLKAALDALIDLAPVTLLHWRQSDMVFAPSELALWRGNDLPFALVMHPLPLPARPEPDGTARLGMIAVHSEHLLGKTLQLDPMPRDQAAGFRQLASMLKEHHQGRIQLDHGDSLELTDGTVLHVRHEKPASADKPGRICVGPNPPHKRVPPTTDAAGFNDRISRLKGNANHTPKLATEIGDKVNADAGPRRRSASGHRNSGLNTPLVAMAVGLPLVLLVTYLTSSITTTMNSMEGYLPRVEMVQQTSIPAATTPTQGTAQD